MIQSGQRHSNCSASSYAIVFLPSMRYGSLSVDTSYQPSGAPFSAAARPASVMSPSTSVTRAPYSRHSSMNGRFASFGMNTSQPRPAAAAYAAAALPAFPAVGSATVFAPRYFARVIAADCPRALNELVGFSDSSLMYSRSRPSDPQSERAWMRGVNPSPSV